MKEKLLKMLNAKNEERSALVTKGETCEDVKELRSINAAVTKLNAEIEELNAMVKEEEERSKSRVDEGQEARTKEINNIESQEKESRSKVPGFGYNPVQASGIGAESRAKTEEEGLEKRGKDLKEKRSVTVSASSILLPKHQATDIKGTFNQVSSLVDAVNIKPLNGGESYSQPYVAGYGEGGYTAEGGAYTETDPTFGYAEINKTKITAYAENTEEVEKLPAAPYAQEVEKGVKIAIRKKISRQILVGTGATNNIMGIFNTSVIDKSTDLAISDIDTTTLDNIMFSYGGDEDVEDAATLILNKKDLAKFAKLRTTDGKKYHTIVSNGNTGTIDGVPYIINSACGDTATADADAYVMAYGPLSLYDLAIFSDLELKKSEEYKFKEGMIAHKGSVFAGGNVVAKNGFLRVKKAKAATTETVTGK